jgi:NADH dehydrogenase
MSHPRVLVVGATGQLGRVIVRRLTARGVAVRALARRADRLAEVHPDVDRAAVDLLDLPRLTDACRGIEQIVATANNNLGAGATSPMRIDLAAYQNLCAAARTSGVGRLIYVSFRGVSRDLPVDIFRLKWHIEDVICRSGVAHVMLRPTAFMDTWIDELLAKEMREKGTATLFGDGTRVSNYIAVDDVAEFAARLVDRPEVVNEAVEVGGPSNLSPQDLVSLLERRLGIRARRRRIPLLALRALPPLVRPFNEVAARLMTLGLYAAACAQPFDGWQASADRFGVRPLTVEDYLDRRFGGGP